MNSRLALVCRWQRCLYVTWVANKRFEISKFKFKIPRARTSELQGSFSAVSKPNFASKYSLDSARRDLHNALLCTVFESQFFGQNLRNFRQFLTFLLLFRDLLD